MKKLRLLFTKECNRNCPKCSNKNHNLNSLPVFDPETIDEYEEILITGGEPMLKDRTLGNFLFSLKFSNKGKIFIYTALPTTNLIHFLLENMIDGITLTLHDNRDIAAFRLFDELLFVKYLEKYDTIPPWDVKKYSLRLNIFENVRKDILMGLKCKWKLKVIKWIDECPLPKNEIFMRYAEN